MDIVLVLAGTFIAICYIAIFVGLFALMYHDWKSGARQTYIREDGTIHEWDRFGNQTLVKPDGSVKILRPEPNKGIGLLD